MNALAQDDPSRLCSETTEWRISWLTGAFGLAGALASLVLHRGDWAAGLLLGSVLAWCNFRWLRRGLDALVVASQAQHEREKPKVPLSTYALALLRYGLLAIMVYVIFKYLHLPLVSIVVGLCSLGLATSAASVWEILTVQDR
jgi:small-conductance mechanosensitive channel